MASQHTGTFCRSRRRGVAQSIRIVSPAGETIVATLAAGGRRICIPVLPGWTIVLDKDAATGKDSTNGDQSGSQA